MDARLGFVPVGQPRVDWDGLDLSRIAELDVQLFAGYDDRKAMTEVRVPGQGLRLAPGCAAG